MRTLIMVLKNYSYPYIEDFLAGVEKEGIGVMCLDSEKIEVPGDFSTEDYRYSYVITDCSEGVIYAHDNNCGFIFYETDSEAAFKVRSAQCIIQSFEGVDAEFVIKMYERFHNIPWTILTTKRLTLREITVNDIDRLYEIYADPSITKYTEPLFEDRDEELAYTRDYIENVYPFFNYGMWIVVENATGRIVGRAGIVNRDGYEEAEIGFIIEKERQRRGYALEICSAIIEYAKEELSMKGLNCFIHPENEASINLAGRLCFEYMDEALLDGVKHSRYYRKLGVDYE